MGMCCKLQTEDTDWVKTCMEYEGLQTKEDMQRGYQKDCQARNFKS